MALRAISPTVKKVRGKVVRAISPTVKKVEGRQWELYPRLLRRWREGWRKLVWRQGNYIRVWAIVSYSGIIVPTLNLNLSQFIRGAAVGGLDIPSSSSSRKKRYFYFYQLTNREEKDVQHKWWYSLIDFLLRETPVVFCTKCHLELLQYTKLMAKIYQRYEVSANISSWGTTVF